MRKTMRITILLTITLLITSTISFAKEITSKNLTKEQITRTKMPISRYPVPDLNKLPDDIKNIFIEVQKKRGFIPNVLLAMAHRPKEFRAFTGYINALVRKKSGLTSAEIQMLIIATSSDNGCMYCVMSHGASLRLITKNPIISDQIAVNYHEADITPRQKAIIDFAMKVSNNSKLINEKDFEALHAHGLNDEDIWDIAGISSVFGLSNRMMNFLKVRPDNQFYNMGR